MRGAQGLAGIASTLAGAFQRLKLAVGAGAVTNNACGVEKGTLGIVGVGRHMRL
ncbi:hypothetical protein D3C84_1252960 [compost metagenome]